MATELLFESSAFMFQKDHSLHLRSLPKNRGANDRDFSIVLGNGGAGNASDDDFPWGDGRSTSQDPLPTSNDFMTPQEVVCTCMSYLQGDRDSTATSSKSEQQHSGLEICYNFSSDSCRMAYGGSLEAFLAHADNPVFQSMVGCARWEVIRIGPEIAGTPTRGAMQTVLVDVVPRVLEADGRTSAPKRNDRKFLWTIVKERRPPRQGHCLVHQCIAIDDAFAHTL